MDKKNEQPENPVENKNEQAFDDQRRRRMQEGDKNERKTADTNKTDNSNNTLQPQQKPLK